ncbi:MAG: DUF2064 domain-containing protein [Acidobacteriota bacterium]|nr:DUF2064 domain-containing protein [Acidobacteriota bacterium]
MNRRATVLFTGDPKREAMRKGLPGPLLSTLHRQLADTVRSAGVALIVASEWRDCFLLRAGEAEREVTSSGLGGKIEAAFRFAFDLGYESVVLLAGDVAGVDVALLDDAFGALERSPERTVIGPSGDGGFYLLGLSSGSSIASSVEWDRLPWFTPSCAASLTSSIRALGGELLFVRPMDDIDSYADAVRVTSRLVASVLRRRLQSVLTRRTPPTDATTSFVRAGAQHVASLRGPPLPT